jgi:hypothetical protein
MSGPFYLADGLTIPDEATAGPAPLTPASEASPGGRPPGGDLSRALPAGSG